MHEINKRTTGTLSAMQPDLEYIPVCSDPRGVHMSEMHKEGAVLKGIHIRIERQSTLFDVMEKAGSVIGGLASGNGVCPRLYGCKIRNFNLKDPHNGAATPRGSSEKTFSPLL